MKGILPAKCLIYGYAGFALRKKYSSLIARTEGD